MNIIERVNENNPNLINLIKNSFIKNRVAHAYLFSAPEGVQIKDEPSLLINSIVEGELTNIDHSNYSDLLIIDGYDKLIKKEIVIKAINKMGQTPLDNRGFRILLIKNIENGNKQSLNSLLKFIEEPKEKTFIIMTTNNLSMVLDTIKSRSQIIGLRAPSKKVIEEKISDLEYPLGKIVSQISPSLEDAKTLSKSKKNLEFINETINIFNTHAGNAQEIVIKLNKLLTKNNYKIIIGTLRILIKDIWKYRQGAETITSFSDSFKKYEKVNCQNILNSLNSFVMVIKKYGNFELAKTRLLLEIGENYE